jgi:hypothetical protein
VGVEFGKRIGDSGGDTRNFGLKSTSPFVKRQAMKTYRSGFKWLGLAIAFGLAGAWIACAEQKQGSEKSIIIRPGSAMSQADEKKMNQILSHYDKSLYRIDRYEKAIYKGTRGTLGEAQIGRKLMAELTEQAKKNGFSHYTMKIGLEVGSGHNAAVPTPTPHGKNLEKESAELVEKLKPILDKYNH